MKDTTKIQKATERLAGKILYGHLLSVSGGAGFLDAVSDHIDAQAKEIERAFSMLSMLGIPRERAGTIANGINVFETRMNKQTVIDGAEIASLGEMVDFQLGKEAVLIERHVKDTAEIARLREALTVISRDAGVQYHIKNIATDALRQEE